MSLYEPYVIGYDDPDKPMALSDYQNDSTTLINKAREIVMEKYNRDIADLNHDPEIAIDELHIVWFSKVLENWKALVVSTRKDGRYYELTYNGKKEETYVDVYIKTHTEIIRDSDR